MRDRRKRHELRLRGWSRRLENIDLSQAKGESAAE
jgi:hypothetical protein